MSIEPQGRPRADNRGRPPGRSNLARRLRAYEMFFAGMNKAEIARELGVTRASVNQWSKKDKWDAKLNHVVARAEESLDNADINRVANIIAKLRARMHRRIDELESLCMPNQHPATRIKAIQLWLKLAGIEQAIPNPTEPSGQSSLTLIQDLIAEEKDGEVLELQTPPNGREEMPEMRDEDNIDGQAEVSSD